MKINEAIKTVVTHANCSDGKASALIIRNVYPDAKYIFLNHNSKEHLELVAEPGMLFCDFTPPKERVKEFVDVGAYVLDHHKHQRDIVEAFGNRGAFGDEVTDPGASGAVLAYREVWRDNTDIDWRLVQIDNQLRHFATLAGVRDCWVKNSSLWVEACHQASALHFYDEDYLFENGFGESEQKLGKYLFEKSLKKAEEIAKNKLFIKGRIAVIAGTDTSDVADFVFSNYDVDILAGFKYNIADNKFGVIVSMRSRSGVDVGEIAKANGGGGHTAAAGFSINEPDIGIVDYIFNAISR